MARDLVNPMDLGLGELAAAVRGRALSARRAVESALERIRERNQAINAFCHLAGESALQEADRVDARIAKGEDPGPLAGVPVAVKDNICTRGLPTSAASRILEGWSPPYDAAVVERLRAAGAIVIGKTNQDEFGMGGASEYSAYGAVRNPWNTSRTAGGSSGGSAAAVAARLVPLALGSDTGGSIRQPGAMCGVTGHKPTYGLVSRYGLLAFASSLDQIGPIARSAEDAALAFRVIAGHDPRDSTSSASAALGDPAGLRFALGQSMMIGMPGRPGIPEASRDSLSGIKIGVAREHKQLAIDPEVAVLVEEGIRVLAAAGAEVREIELPHARFAVACYQLIATAEASSNLARYDALHFGRRAAGEGGAAGLEELVAASRSTGFGAEVKRRIMLGTYVLSAGYYDAYYRKAQQVRTLLRRDYEAAFGKVDAIVSPTSPLPAFELGGKSQDPLAMYAVDVLTVAVNLAGLPAINLPCGFTRESLPVGLQVTAPRLRDEVCLGLGRIFQERTDHHRKAPPGPTET